ncbi:MAG: ABC transporter ATP-binding protein [Clostridia bacterium]|nr:ABC transporter ATP-binding protein [Clostridia bacterium]
MIKEKNGTKLSLSSQIKIVSKSIREYKKPSILAPIFVMMEVVLEVLIPWIMTLLLAKINEISTSGSGNLLLEIVKYGLLLILVATLSLFFGILSGKFCAKAGSGFAKNLRKDLFYKIQDFSFSNIDKFSSSSLVTRMTTDVTNVEMAYMMLIRVAIRAPFMLISALIMAFLINSTMALIFLVTIPILGFGLGFVIYRALPFFKKIFPKYDALNESVEENIRGMRVVKSYVREDYEMQKFNVASSNVKNDFTKAEKIVAFNTPLMNFTVYLALILIFGIGSVLIVKNNEAVLKITELQSFMTYSFQILMSLMMFSMIMVMLIISIEGIKRISEVLTEESSIVSPANAVTEVKNGEIEFNNVSFKYSKNAEKFALDNINLKINSGETVGIIGATGSSKTTLVQLIPRLYDTTDGEVKVSGVNVKEYDLNTLRNDVAMVLQKNVLFSGTVRENMKWGNPNATDEEIQQALLSSQIGNVSLDKVIEQGGVNVSGGQKQRLCIARALLKKPKILILDDSTSAVDTKTDSLIRKAFKNYLPLTTKIIIAQRIASVSESDKIIIMDHGTITAIGTHEELMKTNEIYQELYYSQNKEAEKENM